MIQSILFAAALVAGAAAQQLTINTPAGANLANECEPFQISWSGGTPPYIVTVADQTSAQTVATFSGLSTTSQTWTVNASAGDTLLFSIRDNTGLTESSATFQVQSGTGDSCLTSSGGSTGSTSAAGSPGSSTTDSVASTPASSPTSGSAAAPGSSSTKPASSGASSASKSSSSATQSSAAGPVAQIPAGVFPALAAVLGAAVIAVVA